jgi:hypothetical protein
MCGEGVDPLWATTTSADELAGALARAGLRCSVECIVLMRASVSGVLYSVDRASAVPAGARDGTRAAGGGMKGSMRIEPLGATEIECALPARAEMRRLEISASREVVDEGGMETVEVPCSPVGGLNGDSGMSRAALLSAADVEIWRRCAASRHAGVGGRSVSVSVSVSMHGAMVLSPGG